MPDGILSARDIAAHQTERPDPLGLTSWCQRQNKQSNKKQNVMLDSSGKICTVGEEKKVMGWKWGSFFKE